MLNLFDGITFANPGFFWLLSIIPVLVGWYVIRSGKTHPDILVSSSEALGQVPLSFRQYVYHALFGARMLALALLIIALARPQTSSSKQLVSVEGIDIILALDVSTSMLAEDFRPNRLEASKEVAQQFIGDRPNDRIGLVVFAGESYTQCPLTTDHDVLKNLFRSIKTGIVEDGTALGNGLATAVNRIKESKSISKVVILLTDGVNTSGQIDPLSAAEIARVFGVRVYTIGVGTIGKARYPFQTNFGTQYQMVDVEIDEPLLKQIAGMTEGRYYRATNKQSLEGIYREIDQLEKSKIHDSVEFRKHENFFPLVLIAGLLLCAELILRHTYVKTAP